MRLPIPLLVALHACTDAGSKADSGRIDDTLGPGPCADGGWGAADAASVAEATHVRTDGDDAGDGSTGAPYATLDAARDHTREDGVAKVVVLGPGTWSVGVFDISHNAGGDVTDDDLALYGCGSAETILELDRGIRVNGATGVIVAGLALSGGERALQIWQGAIATVSDVSIRGSTQVGAIVDGAATSATFSSVTISETAPDGDGVGYGLAVQQANLSMEQGGIRTSTGLAVLVTGSGGGDGTGAAAVLSDVEIDTVAASDGAPGRGIQVQELSSLAMTGGSITSVTDAAIFGLMAIDVSASTTIDAVAAGSESAGDGIVITDGAPEEDWADLYYSATLDTNAITGAARAGILITGNGVSATLLGGQSLAGNGYDAVVTQDGPTVGADSTTTLDLSDTPLVFDATAIATIELSE